MRASRFESVSGRANHKEAHAELLAPLATKGEKHHNSKKKSIINQGVEGGCQKLSMQRN